MATVSFVLALALALDPLSILLWLVVGLIAGFLASRLMRGGGYGLVGDIVVGLIGALIGGFLADFLGLGSFGLIGTMIVAFIGACISIAILRAVSSLGDVDVVDGRLSPQLLLIRGSIDNRRAGVCLQTRVRALPEMLTPWQ